MPALAIWRERPLPDAPSIHSVAYGNDTFVAVGSGIFTSADGISWTKRSYVAPPLIEDVTFDGSRFIAIEGRQGSIVDGTLAESSYLISLISLDNGATWSFGTQSTAYEATVAIASEHGTCVAVGSVIQASKDGGQNWQVTYSPQVAQLDPPPQAFFFTAVCVGKGPAGNNLYVAVGGAAQNSRRFLFSAVSTDGLSWKTGKAGRSADLFTSVTYGRGVFVAITSEHRFYTSRDGLHWTQSPYQAADDLYKIVYGQNLFVAVGEHGNIYVSYDGVSWTVKNIGVQELLSSIYYCGDSFIIVTVPYGRSRLYQSGDADDYMLALKFDGYGSVSAQPSGTRSVEGWAVYLPRGTVVTLEAHGENEVHWMDIGHGIKIRVRTSERTMFDGWTGLDANNLLAHSHVNPVTFEMNSNVQVTAHFVHLKLKPPKQPETPKWEMAEPQ